jgi:hypothetical protein
MQNDNIQIPEVEIVQPNEINYWYLKIKSFFKLDTENSVVGILFSTAPAESFNFDDLIQMNDATSYWFENTRKEEAVQFAVEKGEDFITLPQIQLKPGDQIWMGEKMCIIQKEASPILYIYHPPLREKEFYKYDTDED